MLFDLLFAAVFLGIIALGAWRGAVVTGVGLASLVGGYAGGIGAAMRFAGPVERHLDVSPLVAPAVAGTLGFVAAWLLVSSIGDIAVAWDRGRVEGVGRGGFDRTLGGVLGMGRGALVVVLLALLVTWLDAARDLGAAPGMAALPQSEGSAVAGATGNLVEGAVASALSDAGPAGEVAARIAARPGRALGSVQNILADERLNELFADKLFWTLIMNDSIDYAMNRQAVRSMVHDPELRGRFADLGLVDEAAREDAGVFRDALAAVLTDVAPRVHQLHTDPEIEALASDPEIIALVESGDTLALISHPRLKKLVARVSQGI